MTETATATDQGRILDTAALCAGWPQLAEPYAGWDCRETGTPGVWYATRLAEFPEGWIAEWDAEAAREALAAEQMHWQTVNGMLPVPHSLLPAAVPAITADVEDAGDRAQHDADEMLRRWGASDDQDETPVTTDHVAQIVAADDTTALPPVPDGPDAA